MKSQPSISRPNVRENLEWTLLDSMARKDPAAALGLMESRSMMKSSLYQISHLRHLAVMGAQGSRRSGWLVRPADRRRNLREQSTRRRERFPAELESAFIRILLGSSPEAAARRLAALPEDQRGDVLSMYDLSSVPEENQVAHAALIRAQVPEKDQAETIASQMTNLIKRGDYSAATAYLDRIAATPAERAASAMKAIRDMISDKS